MYSNDETAILNIYYKEALSSLLLHASTARPPFSVYIIKKLVACSCCMHEGRDRNSFAYVIKKLCARCCCMYQKARLHAATARPGIFGIHHKEALCSPLLHGYMVRLQFSVYIIKKPCAHHCCMHEWRDCKFRYILYCDFLVYSASLPLRN